jgi:hypothetical protein
MYVFSIIPNFILYIGVTYMYIFRIIFCIVLCTWLHTKLLYESLDNVFTLHNIQTPSFKFSQIVFAPLQKKIWFLLNVNFYHNNFAKLHYSHPWIDLKFWWDIKNYVYYHLLKFQFIELHKMKDLATSLKSPQTKT